MFHYIGEVFGGELLESGDTVMLEECTEDGDGDLGAQGESCEWFGFMVFDDEKYGTFGWIDVEFGEQIWVAGL